MIKESKNLIEEEFKEEIVNITQDLNKTIFKDSERARSRRNIKSKQKSSGLTEKDLKRLGYIKKEGGKIIRGQKEY